MRVIFRKVKGNRYFVEIERQHGPPLVPRFGPGYDELMPHDIAHYLVEEHFNIELGVWGQLAAGGFGVFRPAPSDMNSVTRRRAQRIGRIGRSDMARSEALVVVSVAAWERSIGRHPQLVREVSMDVQVERIQAMVGRLDDVARQWRVLRHGSSLMFEWPRRLTVDVASSARGRRQPGRRAS